jgi:hypothetical protein
MLDESGEKLLQVPASVFEAMFSSLSDGNISLNELFGSASYAVSSTGQRLALYTNSRGYIRVFTCQENSNT